MMHGIILLMSRFCEFRRAKLPTPIIPIAPNGNSITCCLVPARPGTTTEEVRLCLATHSSLAQAKHISYLTTVPKILLSVSWPTTRLENQVIILIARSGLFDLRNGDLFVPSRSITSMVRSNEDPTL